MWQTNGVLSYDVWRGLTTNSLYVVSLLLSLVDSTDFVVTFPSVQTRWRKTSVTRHLHRAPTRYKPNLSFRIRVAIPFGEYEDLITGYEGTFPLFYTRKRLILVYSFAGGTTFTG